jgi:hypothetical protein
MAGAFLLVLWNHLPECNALTHLLQCTHVNNHRGSVEV